MQQSNDSLVSPVYLWTKLTSEKKNKKNYAVYYGMCEQVHLCYTTLACECNYHLHFTAEIDMQCVSILVYTVAS